MGPPRGEGDLSCWGGGGGVQTISCLASKQALPHEGLMAWSVFLTNPPCNAVGDGLSVLVLHQVLEVWLGLACFSSPLVATVKTFLAVVGP